ncbi:MAG: hypothetical protein LBV01_02895 [Deltaproteobacteria bacterium]|jgi:hypothetical protein|nr:hypothetical protein [Deltaproteobacteria bacterium]
MAERGMQAETTATGRRGLIPLLVVSCALNVAVGLALVLASIERTEFGYTVRKLEGMVREREAHANELEVERQRLLSPYMLERKAAELGMRAARPGQIRRMGGATLETPSR